MSCPGLHCPGCNEGGGLLAVGAFLVVGEIVLKVFCVIIAATAASAALSCVVVLLIMRATRCREAAYAASVQHQRIMAEGAAKRQVGAPAQPVLEYHVHHHHYAADSREPARVIPGKVLP